MRIKVTLADGRELEAKDAAEKTRDLIRFEEQFGASATVLSTDAMRLEWLAFLAFTALRRAGQDVGDWPTFKDAMLDEIEVVDEEPVPKDPSGQEAPTE